MDDHQNAGESEVNMNRFGENSELIEGCGEEGDDDDFEDIEGE